MKYDELTGESKEKAFDAMYQDYQKTDFWYEVFPFYDDWKSLEDVIGQIGSIEFEEDSYSRIFNKFDFYCEEDEFNEYKDQIDFEVKSDGVALGYCFEEDWNDNYKSNMSSYDELLDYANYLVDEYTKKLQDELKWYESDEYLKEEIDNGFKYENWRFDINGNVVQK